MEAVVFRKPYDVGVEDVPEAIIEEAGDVVVAVELAAICGSDLHPYRGREKGLDAGTIMGHEFVGRVLEVGSEIRTLEVGDHVVSAFSTSCGACAACSVGLTARCERGQLFGWVENGCGLNGGQAERVRVPLAETTLAGIPEGVHLEAALFAGDILSTGLFAADMAGVAGGASVAVLGCGPVGLMAVVACRERGARRVLAVDPMPERRALAERLGARALDLDRSVADRIRDVTGGRGVDGVLEMVGSPEATRLAVDCVRAGGAIGAAGVHTESEFAFTPGEAYDKNLTYRAGRCPARAYMEEALAVAERRELELASIVTDRVPLSGAVEAYRKFDRREGGCVKVLLEPGRS